MHASDGRTARPGPVLRHPRSSWARRGRAFAVALAVVVLAGACASPSSPVATGAVTTTTAATAATAAAASGAGTPPGVATAPASTAAADFPPPGGTTAPASPSRGAAVASAVPTPRAGGPVTGTSGVPAFAHVYVIVMENHGLSGILGNGAAPYLNSLIARYGLATDYRAVAHPSEPNYLALFSGSTQGVSDDGVHNIAAVTIADQLDAAGRTWRVFAQNVPPGCFQGYSARGGPDGPGTYARKHEPAISFTDISGNPARCANITDFARFDPASADYELIIPNMCNDMHDCGVAQGDRFLAGFVPRILDSAAWQRGGVLFITWDEGSGSEPVATLVIAPGVPAGFRSSVPHDHYSLLRTIEDAWGLPCLAHACSANAMAEFFPAASAP